MSIEDQKSSVSTDSNNVEGDSRYQKDVMTKLDALGANRECQACGNKGRTVLSMVTHIGAAPEGFGQDVIGDFGVPSAIVACTKCGDMRFHYLHALGLV